MSSARDGLFHVDVIVLDEVHYLSDISRGTVWEEIVSAYCCRHTSFTANIVITVFSNIMYEYFRLFIPQKKFNSYVCPQQLQIQMNWLVGLVRYLGLT